MLPLKSHFKLTILILLKPHQIKLILGCDSIFDAGQIKKVKALMMLWNWIYHLNNDVDWHAIFHYSLFILWMKCKREECDANNITIN